MTITSRQQKFLDLLNQYFSEFSRAPSLEELRKYLEDHGWPRIASLNSVKQYLDSLEATGMIKRRAGHRGIALPAQRVQPDSGFGQLLAELISIPLLASPVSCGAPTNLLAEHAVDRIQISRRLVRAPSRTYAFRVSGDSMDLAGISDGDLVLVEATPELRDGDRVLATIDGCGTVKRFRRTAEIIILQPESSNPINKPIYLHLDDEFVIGGKVVGVLKN